MKGLLRVDFAWCIHFCYIYVIIFFSLLFLSYDNDTTKDLVGLFLYRHQNAKPKRSDMLWTILVILIILWLLGFIGGVGGNLIHLLLVVALIVFILRFVQGRTV